MTAEGGLKARGVRCKGGIEYNQPPFWGGWCCNSAGGCPIIERSKKFAEKGAIKSVNVLLVGD